MWPSTPMGRQRLLLACSLAGVILGAALIGVWAVGVAVIADSVFGVWLALFREVPGSSPEGWDDMARPGVYDASPVEQVLERAWRAS